MATLKESDAMKEGYFWPDKFKYNGNNWTMLRMCGKGTFSSCYHVCNEHGNNLALKVFKKETKYQAAFTNELQILRSLKDGLTQQKDSVSFVIKYIDSFTLSEHECILMELLGSNLQELLIKNEMKGFSYYLIKKCFHDLISAVVFLEQLGLVHGDIKPTNILWNINSNCFQLIDFGLSFAYGSKPHQQLQSPGYQAPEVLLWNREITEDQLAIPLSGSQRGSHILLPSMDLWSVGCVVVYISTGQQLYATEHAQSLPFLCTNCATDSGPCSHSRKAKNILSSIGNKLRSDEFDNLTNVLCGLLQCCPGKRLSSQVVLKHPFLMANMAQEPDIADFILLPTIILRLLNMFDTTEDEEKQDILTDIKEECQDFGPVLSVTSHKKTDIDLEYNVYVEFKNAADC